MSQNNTKFSHRLFSQYFISTTVPLLILVLLTFFTVSTLLNKNARRQIYAESRAVGLTLFDRLLTVDTDLIVLSEQLNSTGEINTSPKLEQLYYSLYSYSVDGIKQQLYGSRMYSIDLDEEQKKHLANNKSLLMGMNHDSRAAELLMLHPVSIEQEQYLIAILNPEYLWNITIRETDGFCALLENNIIANCSSELQTPINSLLSNEDIKTKDSLIKVGTGNRRYLGNAWDLFTQPQFGMDKISILYFMPRADVLQDYKNFTKMFPIWIFIAVLTVVFLSSVQMRRSLTPLNKLIQGARDIIAGDYTKPVNIKSNDEFEILATTFNDMSDRINDQFNKIKALAKIDRLILSTPDADYIIEVLIEYVPSVVKADNVLIAILSPNSLYNATLIYNMDSTYKDIRKTNVILKNTELDEISREGGVLQKTAEMSISYLNPLVKLGDNYFLICTIRDKNDLLGIICAGFNDEKKMSREINSDLLEIADRAAIALSNANWEKKLLHQAHYDALTKLPNRYLFKDRLEQALERAKRNEQNVAVLFIDLDRFKSVNDSLGHVIGDQLLVEVANILLQCVRSYDSVARFGGDEFTVILSDMNDDEIKLQTEKLSNRIIEQMLKPLIINDREFYISPSIGIAIYPRDAENFDDLLKNADTAMYEAKNISTGNYQFYKKQQNKNTLARLELENDLRHAMEKNQLELHYQPKINLRNSMIYDVEALIRWRHPERGYISPAIFIPLAEETGLINNIGYWVIRTACEQSEVWREKGIELKIAVNISADQFRQPNLYERIINIFEETGAKSDSIELEITESITIENFSKTINLLTRFREYGLNICIDDFGTGYSSMTYLQKMPVNKLKIDKSFIDNIHLDDDSASITKAIVALAHNLDLTVVAEGVETKAQYDYLIAINCDEAQGFFLSKPLPKEELVRHILMYNSRSAKIN